MAPSTKNSEGISNRHATISPLRHLSTRSSPPTPNTLPPPRILPLQHNPPSNPPILPPSLNPLISIPIQPPKILPHLLLPTLHTISLPQSPKPLPQSTNRLDVKLVLVCFEVSELRELLVAVVEPAGVRLCGGVDDFVGADIAVLGESFAADVAVVGAFAGVAAFVGFEVANMRVRLR